MYELSIFFLLQIIDQILSGKNNKYQSSLPEDLRVSKLLRRLLMEDNTQLAIELCKKVDTAVRNKANALYIYQSFDYLFETMISILQKCPVECLEIASGALGIMGYIKRTDYQIYQMHLMKAYSAHSCIRKYLMIALKTTLR